MAQFGLAAHGVSFQDGEEKGKGKEEGTVLTAFVDNANVRKCYRCTYVFAHFRTFALFLERPATPSTSPASLLCARAVVTH